MLHTLRRLVSFADWTRHHPSQPPDGGDLDATFDALFNGLADLERKLLDVRRSDGSLKPELITLDSLHPLLAEKIGLSTLDFVKDQLAEVEIARRQAVSAKILAEQALVAVSAAAARALRSAQQVDAAREPALERANAALAEARDLLARAAAVSAAIPAPTDYAGDAQAWASASMLWAEHMPDTLPRNSLVWQDISGDHWSARWWANQAANAFGMLTSLYLGVHSDPPATNNNGGPIQPGSIYYDLEDQIPYVWDGDSWAPFYSGVNRAGLMTLWYRATADQTVFPLTVLDLAGLTFAMNQTRPEQLDVSVNGVKLMAAADWTVTVATSTVTFLRPLRAGDMAAVDILMPVASLAPGAVTAYALKPLTGVDGTAATFALAVKVGAIPVAVNKAEELVVSLDGVLQEPGVSYSATAASITFNAPPAVDSHIFITWFKTGS